MMSKVLKDSLGFALIADASIKSPLFDIYWSTVVLFRGQQHLPSTPRVGAWGA